MDQRISIAYPLLAPWHFSSTETRGTSHAWTCLDNDPAELVLIADGATMFSELEVSQLRNILARIQCCIGEAMHDLAFEVISKTFHTATERELFGAGGG